MKFKNQTDSIKFTAFGMVVIVLIFYPLFEYLNKFTETVTTRFLKKGKNVFGRSLGIYISFLILLSILYYMYARVWFHLDVIKIIYNSIF